MFYFGRGVQPGRSRRARRRRRARPHRDHLRRAVGHVRRVGGAGQPARPPPGRPRHRRARPRRDLLVQQPRVCRDDARRVQAPGRPDQRELPLRRGRAASTCSTTPTSWPSSTRREFSPADRRGQATGCRCFATSSRSTTARRPSTIGAVALRGRAGAASRPSATSGRAPTTTSTSSTPAERPGFPKGVVWRHEDVFRTLGGGIDFVDGRAGRRRVRAVRGGDGNASRRSACLRAADARRRAVGDARRTVPRRHDRAPRRSSTRTTCGRPSSGTSIAILRSPATRWPGR